MTGFVTVASTAGQVVNFTTSLEFDPTDTTNAAAGSIAIARMRSTRWFIEPTPSPRSGNSLYVQRFGAAKEEVADGVQSMALTYHQYSGGNPATFVASPSDFNYVDAVRMVLQLKGTDIDNRPLTRTASTTIKIRSRPQ
jgi:type IV pilus assembly protein PilW